MKKIFVLVQVLRITFPAKEELKIKPPQAPLFPVCLVLVTAGDGVLAWKASY